MPIVARSSNNHSRLNNLPQGHREWKKAAPEKHSLCTPISQGILNTSIQESPEDVFEPRYEGLCRSFICNRSRQLSSQSNKTKLVSYYRLESHLTVTKNRPLCFLTLWQTTAHHDFYLWPIPSIKSTIQISKGTIIWADLLKLTRDTCLIT